ncbi:MAG: hypothetical protein R3E39_17095 [Anaerolineae bacterium]
MTIIADETVQQDAVYALAQSTPYLYAARLSGLHRSEDGGHKWTNTFATLERPIGATAVAVAGSTVFAGVNGAVLRSHDNGQHWQISPLASPPPHVVALAVSPNLEHDRFIAAGTAEDGVFISTDGGETWTAWNFGLLDLHIFALLISPNFAQDNLLFAGTESGIFRSHNGGRGWRELAFPIDSAPVLSLAVSPNFAVDGRMYAGSEISGLFISDDSGLSWQRATNTDFDGAVNAIHITASKPESVWLLAEDQLLRSTNNAQSWSLQHTLPTDKLAMAMAASNAASEPNVVGFADGTIMHLS